MTMCPKPELLSGLLSSSLTSEEEAAIRATSGGLRRRAAPHSTARPTTRNSRVGRIGPPRRHHSSVSWAWHDWSRAWSKPRMPANSRPRCEMPRPRSDGRRGGRGSRHDRPIPHLERARPWRSGRGFPRLRRNARSTRRDQAHSPGAGRWRHPPSPRPRSAARRAIPPRQRGDRLRRRRDGRRHSRSS